ncbi:MAG: molybdopterin-dependent oxidoreductase, partial [Chloroflexi bacterium]|nr:molybdopterin-dependent oxidoreductase [Chloroflexota bacterium]
LEAQRAGARVIVVDPWRTRTAAHADRHLAIRPGTDAALALGLMHVILADGLADEEYVERHTVGIEPFRERAAEFSPSRVAEITGISEADVRWLAHVYATTRPAAICWGLGLQRTSGGGAAARALTCLPALTGAWRDIGGGIVRGSTFVPLAWNRLQRPDLVRRGTRTINMVELGKALTDQQLAPPIRALYVYNSNPVAVAPDQNRVVAGLRRDNLFTVVHEQFLTDTADYADVVLPATTQLEHLDLVPSWGHYYLTFNEPAIEPLGQARPNNWVFRELARRLELAEPCLYDSDEELVRQALSSGHPWLEGLTFERLREQGYVRVAVPRDGAPFAEGGFPTRSGKCELYSERLAKRGADPLPTFIPPRECASTNPGLAARFPLALLTPKAHHFLNSSYGALDSLVRQEGEPLLFMHSADATARGLSDGQCVEVYNGRGSFSARLRVSADARVGVVLSPAVWWGKRSESRTNSNATVSSELTDLGRGPVFYDNLVEVRAATTRTG